jgi:hypothetical protein
MCLHCCQQNAALESIPTHIQEPHLRPAPTTTPTLPTAPQLSGEGAAALDPAVLRSHREVLAQAGQHLGDVHSGGGHNHLYKRRGRRAASELPVSLEGAAVVAVQRSRGGQHLGMGGA